MAIKIFIIDTQLLFCEGLVSLLNKEKELEVIGFSKDPNSALLTLKNKKPNIVLIELSFLKNFEIANFISQNREIKFIGMSNFYNEREYLEALKYGIVGFISKEDTKEKFLKIINSVHKEGHSIPRNLSLYILNEIKKTKSTNEFSELTETEKKVLTLLCKGLTNKHIARELKIKEKTVRNHLSNIYLKLGVNSRTQAILKVLEMGQLSLNI